MSQRRQRLSSKEPKTLKSTALKATTSRHSLKVEPCFSISQLQNIQQEKASIAMINQLYSQLLSTMLDWKQRVAENRNKRVSNLYNCLSKTIGQGLRAKQILSEQYGLMMESIRFQDYLKTARQFSTTQQFIERYCLTEQKNKYLKQVYNQLSLNFSSPAASSWPPRIITFSSTAHQIRAKHEQNERLRHIIQIEKYFNLYKRQKIQKLENKEKLFVESMQSSQINTLRLQKSSSMLQLRRNQISLSLSRKAKDDYCSAAGSISNEGKENCQGQQNKVQNQTKLNKLPIKNIQNVGKLSQKNKMGKYNSLKKAVRKRIRLGLTDYH